MTRSARPFPGITQIEIDNWDALPPELALNREARRLRQPAPGVLTLVFWRPERPAIVLGKGRPLDEELFVPAARADSVRIIVRPSGGGTVYMPGYGDEGSVLCAAVVLPASGSDFPNFPIGKIHALGGEILAGAFAAFGLVTSVQGTSDLVVGNRKVAGSAQCRRKNAILYHASILIKAPVNMMERYLRMPSKMPEYRAGRPHREFVTDLSTLTGREPRELLDALPALIEQSARRFLGL